MEIIVFDPQPARNNLLPLTYTRPVGDLRIGITTISEKWQRLLPGEYSWATEPYLGELFPCCADTHSALFVAGNVVPDANLAAAVATLGENESLHCGDTIVARRGDGQRRRDYTGEPPVVLQHVYDIFLNNGKVICADFEAITAGRTSQPLSPTVQVIGPRELVFVEEGASLECCVLKYTEKIIRHYLAKEMGRNAPDGGDAYDLFATEGGTAAMCYIFDSLQANHLLKKGDRIALMTPIFTPYIEIPELDRYGFDVVNISANQVDADGYHRWEYTDEALDQLRDPSVKLVCLVNPSNPPSYRLSDHDMERIVDIVRTDNPDLMVVTDDVYGTFARNFESLMYSLPYNTLCVYSFSKYFGATGWRLAVVALARNNVFDSLISRLPAAEKADLEKRYSSLTTDVAGLRFIDRMVADSRSVALNHTAGLSTPQQIQMGLFAAMCLLDKDDAYKQQMQSLVRGRLEALWRTTGFTLLPDPLRVGYYSEIDIMVWAKKFYGDDFAEWLAKEHEPLDFVMRLATDTSVVLLNGSGFDGPEWSIRASLANLNEADYLKIGTAIRHILDGYYNEYKKTPRA